MKERKKEKKEEKGKVKFTIITGAFSGSSPELMDWISETTKAILN